MKAAHYARGQPLTVDSFPAPLHEGNTLLVKMAACSVNPVDVKIHKAAIPFIIPSPKITGSDGSGVVVAAPPNCKFQAGDVVYFMSNPVAKWGTAAQFSVVPVANAELVPLEHIDVFSAAALPLAALTAWQALHKSMPLAGKRVFVSAGSGGVGHIAIQMTKAQGAHVTTTCSGANEALCKELGADRVIDYNTTRFEDVAVEEGGYDCVVNMVDGQDARSLGVVKHGGHFSQVMRNVGDPHEWVGAVRGKLLVRTGRLGAHTMVMVKPDASLGLQQTSRLIAEGKLRPVVGHTLPLEQAAEAHSLVTRGSGCKGKVVLKVVESMEALMEGVAK